MDRFPRTTTRLLDEMDSILGYKLSRIISQGPNSKLNKTENAQPDRDTYALLRDNYNKDPKMQALWEEVNTVPSWVDWDQIKRGQEVFHRYAPGAIAGFAFQGLLASTVSLYTTPRHIRSFR